MPFSLIPKNDKYFEDFDRQMELVRVITSKLREATSGPRLPKDLWPGIKEVETKADSVVKAILSRLESSFVTPIEREDIHLLAVNIDDMADALEAAVSRLDVFEIEEPTVELRNIVNALDEMAEQLVLAVKALRTLKPGIVRDATTKVDLLEEKVDGLFRESQRALFKRRPEAYDLVRWKEVYDHLEEAADYGRHIARTVNHILVRHS
jgi:uncharacterized protein Yka (UPF0111/DUF47 family)